LTQADDPDLPQARCLTEEEYYAALDAKIAGTLERETELRMEAWWRSNDAFRGDTEEQAIKPVLQAARDANMLRLLVMIEEHDDHDSGLMRAELHRELGEFDLAIAESQQVLATEPESGYREAALKIETLANDGDRFVREWT
jgi:hypothetical protein